MVRLNSNSKERKLLTKFYTGKKRVTYLDRHIIVILSKYFEMRDLFNKSYINKQKYQRH